MTEWGTRGDSETCGQPFGGLLAAPRAAQSGGGSGSGNASVAASGVERLFSSETIRRRVMKIASQINRDYRGRTIHLVTVLEGSFVFVADLVRALRVDVVCHFLSAKTLDSSLAGLPFREIVYSPRPQLSGQDVLLVDGILETGITLDYLYNSIAMQQPRSLRTAALLEKSNRKKVGLAADYLGFATRAGYLVGYGLGRRGKFQNLPYIAAVRPSVRTSKRRSASNKLDRRG